MEVLVVLLALIAGLLLTAAAFVYLVDPSQAQKLLGNIRAPILVVIGLCLAITVLKATDHRLVLAGLAALSVAAYLIRESRKPQREKPPSFGGAERQPVLPGTVPTEEKERQEERDRT